VTNQSTTSAEIWRDPAAQSADRVADLMDRMSLREKVAQIYGVWVGVDAAGGDMALHQHELTAAPADWAELISRWARAAHARVRHRA
jgi:beta-xylosidase